MSESHQLSGIIDIPLLRPEAASQLAEQLTARRAEYPVSLILPCHARELGTPALERIVHELSAHAPWLDRIVVGLDSAEEPAFAAARELFSRLPQRTDLLWNDGPAGREIYGALTRQGHPADTAGKGRNVWTCLTYLHAEGQQGAAAMHDCDIASYSVDMLVRLCWPVRAQSGITFSRGYSARFTDRLHARVERLLFRPVIQALQSLWWVTGDVSNPDQLTRAASWQYALAGECAIDLNRGAQFLHLPAGWGLETALACHLAERDQDTVQVELASSYDHRHHELSAGDPDKGLHRMAREVTATLLDEILRHEPPGVQREILDGLALAIDSPVFRALRKSRHAASANGLHFPEQDERDACLLFSQVVKNAAKEVPYVPRLPPPATIQDDMLTALKAAAFRL